MDQEDLDRIHMTLMILTFAVLALAVAGWRLTNVVGELLKALRKLEEEDESGESWQRVEDET